MERLVLVVVDSLIMFNGDNTLWYVYYFGVK